MNEKLKTPECPNGCPSKNGIIDFESLRGPFDRLSPEVQIAIAQTIRASAGQISSPSMAALPAATADGWLTISDAARVAGVDKVTISRLIDRGILGDNGLTHRHRRVEPLTFYRWALSRDERPEPAGGVPASDDPPALERWTRVERLRKQIDDDFEVENGTLS